MHQGRSPLLIPKIPQTPGPQAIDNIQLNAKDRFVGMIWIQKDDEKNSEEYFSEYDHFEKYSETKTYSKRPYQAAYKGLIKDYNNYLCVLNSDNGDEYYVVAKRIRGELETLESYCTCCSCSSSIFNPLKYLWCPICTKCIKAGPGFASPLFISKAKELKAAAEQRKHTPSKYNKYIPFCGNIHFIKIIEIITLAFVFLILLYLFL